MRHCNESSPDHQLRAARVLGLCALLALAGCETLKPPPSPPPPALTIPPPKEEALPAKPPAAGIAGVLRQGAWRDLPEWEAENPALAWGPFLASCSALGKQEAWREVCAAAESIKDPDREQARRFFELNFTPFQLTNIDGGDEGLITGYYEPLLKGSRQRSARYRLPVYGVPDDLLVIDLTEVYPELKGMRLRGRLDGQRVVPYYDRAQIEQGRAALAGKEIA